MLEPVAGSAAVRQSEKNAASGPAAAAAGGGSGDAGGGGSEACNARRQPHGPPRPMLWQLPDLQLC